MAVKSLVSTSAQAIETVLRPNIGKQIQITSPTGEVIQGTLSNLMGNLAIVENTTTNYVMVENIVWFTFP
ncbi:hypothetical protein [Paenibacillus caui]|uniref:hypothetical protein n=1 Tax=Paenibacillus caui TaxID=2873927 RepID=UPI001CA81E52|nr:hypothetical protein [Paenibacillus caui]